MAAASYYSTFYFGIEVELLLESPRKKHSTWESLAKDLSKRLSKAGIRNRVHGNDYTEWSIVREVTVQDPDGKNPYQYGVELVSPVHTTTSLPALTSELTKIFTAVNAISTPLHSPRCSSHIHISRHPTLAPDELAALAKATLYFERALDALMPPERRDPRAHWTQSNRHAHNPSLAGLSLAECVAQVDAALAVAATGPPTAEGAADTRPVVETMNLMSKDSRYGVVRRRRAHFVRGKTCKWDFSGLLTTPRADDADRGVEGTVEFRQPPGSLAAAEAVVWVVLGAAFVAGAVEVGMGLGWESVAGEEGGSAEELWGLLETGREVLGWEDLKGVEGLFWEAQG